MKLKKLLFISPIVLMASSPSITLTSCSNNIDVKVNSVEVRNVPFYTINMTTDPYSYKLLEDQGLTRAEIYHFNKSNIPYIKISDYVANYMQFRSITRTNYANYVAESENNKTTVTNDVTKATCVVDFATQKMIFSDYDLFLEHRTDVLSPLAAAATDDPNYFVYDSKSVYISGGQYEIDFTKYNIKLYFWNNEGYAPLYLLRNLWRSYASMPYYFYNGEGLYPYLSTNTQQEVDLLKSIRPSTNILNQEYMEYTYNLLAVTLDNTCGLTERPSRVDPNTTIKFLPNGAYAALKPYHDRIVSMDLDVSNTALSEFFAKEINDGGHARYQSINLLSTKPVTEDIFSGTERNNTFKVKNSLVNQRKTVGLDPETKCSSSKAKGYYEEYDYTVKGETQKVAYLTMDEFESPTLVSEEGGVRALPEYTTDDNYYEDTVRLTMYANEKIHTNNVKNVVIDISTNGGGYVWTGYFMASWICNGITDKLFNPKTKAYSEFRLKADINGDDKIDSNDYIGDDVNVYIITSNASFSCANAFPCHVADERQNAVFLGQKSGGGCCVVQDEMYLGLANTYRNSYVHHQLRNESTPDNLVSNESGCPNNYYIDPIADASKYFDRDAINKKILGIE